MNTDAFDAARAELVRDRDTIALKIDDYEDALTQLRQGLAVADAAILYFDRARELLLAGSEAPAPEPQQPPERHSVQRAVMALFEAPNARIFEPAIAEATIIKRTNLPEASVHAFLLRAVRAGKLLVEDGWYRLPPASDAPAPPATPDAEDAAE